MIYFLTYFEKEFRQIIIMALLLVWASVATYHSIVKKDETLLFQMNGFDTRLIDASQHPPIEVENFFHNFVGLFYSYTSKNYEDHINRASHLVDINLLKKYSPKLNSMFDRVQKSKTNQVSFIQKISKIQDLEYEIHLNVQRFEGDFEKANNYRIRLKVEKVKRTIENPFGLIVRELEEVYE